MYHAFSFEPAQNDPLNLTVTAQSLERQLSALRNHGWTMLDLDAYVTTAAWRGRHSSVLVTIDDGYASVAEIAAPIFAKHGVRPLMFVPPALIGQRGAAPTVHARVPAGVLMGADELRHLAATGFDIGVHGLDHQEMVGMTDAQLHTATVEARHAVADLSGHLPRAFAYPVGLFDDRARLAVQRAGYDVAFSVHRDAGRFAVSRVDVTALDSDRSFQLKLMPGYRRVWRTLDRARFVRRIVRRAFSS